MEKTIISIVDEFGVNSSITLEKWVSDILHENLGSVHEWVQKVYILVCKQNIRNSLKLSRREIGNVVRRQACIKAMELDPIEINFDFSELDMPSIKKA